MKIRSGYGRFFKWILNSAMVGLFTLMLFELCFRLHVIDFYSHVFQDLNSEFDRSEAKPDMVLVGDSFSAFKKGYAQVLNDSFPEFNMHNISVPGTSVREQHLFGKYHIKRLQPEVVIFQYFVGNDLLGWHHHLNWEEISVVRNAYWRISEHLWSIGYLNHRLASIRAYQANEVLQLKKVEAEFSPESFSVRDRRYFRAEPDLIENSVYLKNGRSDHMEDYLLRMNKLFESIPKKTKIFILVIPHEAQVSEAYKERTEALNAVFTNDFRIGSGTYPVSQKMTEYFSTDERIEVLDPTAEMAQWEEDGQALYFSNNSHLNYKGQIMIGEYLVEKIRSFTKHSFPISR